MHAEESGKKPSHAVVSLLESGKDDAGLSVKKSRKIRKEKKNKQKPRISIEKQKQHINQIEENMEQSTPKELADDAEYDSGSIAGVLIQAIKTQDKNLFETLINTTDKIVIDATVKTLSSSYASKLLFLLQEAIKKAPARLRSFTYWIQKILQVHAIELSKERSSRSLISNLHDHITTRLEAYRALAGISARTDILLQQLLSKATSVATEKKRKVADIQTVPLITMEEIPQNKKKKSKLEACPAPLESL